MSISNDKLIQIIFKIFPLNDCILSITLIRFQIQDFSATMMTSNGSYVSSEPSDSCTFILRIAYKSLTQVHLHSCCPNNCTSFLIGSLLAGEGSNKPLQLAFLPTQKNAAGRIWLQVTGKTSECRVFKCTCYTTCLGMHMVLYMLYSYNSPRTADSSIGSTLTYVRVWFPTSAASRQFGCMLKRKVLFA